MLFSSIGQGDFFAGRAFFARSVSCVVVVARFFGESEVFARSVCYADSSLVHKGVFPSGAEL